MGKEWVAGDPNEWMKTNSPCALLNSRMMMLPSVEPEERRPARRGSAELHPQVSSLQVCDSRAQGPARVAGDGEDDGLARVDGRRGGVVDPEPPPADRHARRRSVRHACVAAGVRRPARCWHQDSRVQLHGPAVDGDGRDRLGRVVDEQFLPPHRHRLGVQLRMAGQVGRAVGRGQEA